MYRVKDVEEQRQRTLYVRVNHTIRDPKEIEALFDGNVRVKLPRQPSRGCHVIFSNVEERMKGHKALKGKKLNGKRVIATVPKTKLDEKKVSRKKIVVPIPKPQKKITRTLFVSNIDTKVTVNDLKKAFPDCHSVTLLEPNSSGMRSAFVKMNSLSSAGEYFRMERKSPVLCEKKLKIQIDTRSPKKKKSAKVEKMKVYDEDGEQDDNEFEHLNRKKPQKNGGKKGHVPEAQLESDSDSEVDADSDLDSDAEAGSDQDQAPESDPQTDDDPETE
ncbi:uncharacterized protein LOC105687999 [Athalia rosae]|uniref:uncharacterized protein LOC105687999 n=1 Tax=Athalia rosae TaxID=37344 RepID=UPI00203453CB|nr:uncharacterized protein LOC105687999 [Athalia rosae]